jgi:hypothetical protein
VYPIHVALFSDYSTIIPTFPSYVSPIIILILSIPYHVNDGYMSYYIALLAHDYPHLISYCHTNYIPLQSNYNPMNDGYILLLCHYHRIG